MSDAPAEPTLPPSFPPPEPSQMFVWSYSTLESNTDHHDTYNGQLLDRYPLLRTMRTTHRSVVAELSSE